MPHPRVGTLSATQRAVATTPPPPKQRQRPGPKVNLGWRHDFVVAYEQQGGFYASAKTAGVDSSTVYDEMARDPAFKARVEEAKQRYADTREANLARLADNGNVVGDIVLLKKFRPHEYIEKNLSITASFSAELDSASGQQLLHAMLANLTPESVKQLAPQGGVLSAPAGSAQNNAPGEGRS